MLDNAKKAFDYVEKIGMTLGALAIAIICVLTVFDVVTRKLGFHVSGIFEVCADYFMVVLAFLPISYLYAQGGHIRVTVVVNRMPKSVIRWVERILNVFVLIYSALIVYTGFLRAMQAFEMNEISPNVLGYPLGPTYLMVPIGVALLVVRLIQVIIKPDSLKKNGEDD